MASLLVRGLDESIKHTLRVIAAQNGRSMEAEARVILTDAVIRTKGPAPGHGSWFEQMHAVFRRYDVTDDEADQLADLDQPDLPDPAVRFD